ncbi:MAG: hypothetical protein AB1941_27290 [Gemmatimonadota bacterium]
MPKDSYASAAARSKERLKNGRNRHNNAGDWVAKLTKLCDDLHAADKASTESTTAAGRMGSALYVARQGSKKLSLDQDELKRLFSVATVVDASYRLKDDDGLNMAGLHAEMMVVRYILENVRGVAKDQLGRLGLQIGTTKGCCLNCAGWLNEQGIPHTDSNLKASIFWRHPMTLSLYRHYNTVENNFVNLKHYKGWQQAALLDQGSDSELSD